MVMKNHTAYELYIIVTLTQNSFGRLTNNGKGFGEEIIQRFAFRVALLELNEFS